MYCISVDNVVVDNISRLINQNVYVIGSPCERTKKLMRNLHFVSLICDYIQ